MKDILIGIDAGTSVIKSVAFDLAGEQVAISSCPNSYDVAEGGAAEQDMESTWANTAATLKGLAEKVPDLAGRTAAVAVTGQGDGTWLIDKQGDPVAPGWLWLDARAGDLVEAYRARPEDEARFRKTGTGIAACQQAAQMMWMERHAPSLLEKAATAMHCKDWLYFRMTGMRAGDPSEAGFTFGDFRTGDYSDEVIGLLGLEKYKSLLPPMVEGTKEVAALTAEAARRTGLLEGTPISLGYIDVACTALGAGLYEPGSGSGCSIVGSTGVHLRLAASPDDVVLNEDRTGYTMAMPLPGVLGQLQSNMSSTLNIDWLLDLATGLLASQGVNRSRSDLIPMIDEWIAPAQPAGLLYQPYVSEAGERGPFVDGHARAGFVGLSTLHGYGDMMRSVLEALAFAARDCYTVMGPLPTEIRLAGGASQSSSLSNIFGAVMGAGIRKSTRSEAGATGAAMMAAVAIGQYETMEACASEWVAPYLGNLEVPDPELAALYDSAFPAYVASHKALRPVWKMLADRHGGAL